MTATRSTEPVIRAANESDVDDIARIWQEGWADGHAGHVPEELYRHRTPETYPPRVIERIGATWLAERDGAALGFVVVIGDEVEQVYVDAAARGTGVAALLLEHAEHVIAGSGHERAWLAVVSGNVRARAFYERAGWHDAGAFDYEAETASGFVLVPCRRYEKSLTVRTDAAPRRV
jgi:GNAT superfamily N-acetyltransferase